LNNCRIQLSLQSVFKNNIEVNYMYAIVEIAGKQFKVTQDQFVYAPLMDGEEGASVEFDKVLLLDNDGNVEVGAPLLSGVKVSGKILGHVKGDKVIVFKKKRRKGFKKKNGHRQNFTKIQISDIVSGKSSTTKKKAAKAETEEVKGDDLTLISGIGPVFAGHLNELGYTSFKQIAKLTAAQITEIAEKIDGVSEDLIANEEWVKQAKELSKK
jgi:large subunit ribosomal protein L21